ncbi:MAG: aminopeptidase P family protein [Spirochaetes bacterium]|nr:aminopeptidase P family protein [Spirochaetota bacterium]
MSKTDGFYRKRRDKLYGYLDENSIDFAVIRDTRGRRNSSVRYLTGHPSDAVLLITKGKSFLIPWDINVAEKFACCEEMIPFANFNHDIVNILESLLNLKGIKNIPSPVVEITKEASYPLVKRIKQSFPEYQILCRDNGIDDLLLKHRMIKDSEEINILQTASGITDRIIESIKDMLVKKPGCTELEIALFIESEARKMHAEGTAFESLIAGAKRSYAIHAYPSYKDTVFTGKGIFLIDFGIRYRGYCSDVTIPFFKKPLTSMQKKMLDSVIYTYSRVTEEIAEKKCIKETVRHAKELLEKQGFTMPHALGHGIGLDVHEAPYISAERTDPSMQFGKDMVFTIEPGLYDEHEGGIRLENDFLITEHGTEALTHSGPVEL